MDSLKIFNGYDKVENKHNNLENQQQQQHNPKISKPLITTISIIITTLFITITLSSTLYFHHHRTTESPNPVNSLTLIQLICNVTRYPDSCITALSPSAQTANDPITILKLSLLASIDELTELDIEFGDCKELINDAVSRLNDSVLVVPDDAVSLTDGVINDVMTWVSAALTDQQTCVDGLEEIGFSDVEKVKKVMRKSNEYVSNSLAIVANIRSFLHLPIH